MTTLTDRMTSALEQYRPGRSRSSRTSTATRSCRCSRSAPARSSPSTSPRADSPSRASAAAWWAYSRTARTRRAAARGHRRTAGEGGLRPALRLRAHPDRRRRKKQPTMHACGHDFHTVAGLGAARLLAAHRATGPAPSSPCSSPVRRSPPAPPCGGRRPAAEYRRRRRAWASTVLTSPAAGKVAGFRTGAGAELLGVDAGAGARRRPSMARCRIWASIRWCSPPRSSAGSRPWWPGRSPPATSGWSPWRTAPAGTSANIIPDRAELALNFRAYSEQVPLITWSRACSG